MPKATWGNVTAGALKQQERRQYKPYDGPQPPNGVYCFKVKVVKKTLSSKKNPQLMIGFELVPRRSRPDDQPYKGYFITEYAPVMDSTLFRVVPFIDAIGVSESDFTDRTIVDKEGKILSIGRVKFNEKSTVYVMVQIGDGADGKGNSRKEVVGMWSPDVFASQAESDDAATEDDGDYDTPAEDEEPLPDDDEPMEEEAPEPYTEAELKAKTPAELKAIIKDEFESTPAERASLKTKGQAITWILQAQGPLPEDEAMEPDPEPDPEPTPAPRKRAAARKSAPAEDDEPPF